MSAYDDLLKLSAPVVEEAIEACPWRDTDHLGERRYNYCTWCDGYVTAKVSPAPGGEHRG